MQRAILANSCNLRQTVLKLQLQRALFDHDSKRMKFNMGTLKLLISLVTKLSSGKWKKIVGEIMGEQDELGNSDSCADADEDEWVTPESVFFLQLLRCSGFIWSKWKKWQFGLKNSFFLLLLWWAVFSIWLTTMKCLGAEIVAFSQFSLDKVFMSFHQELFRFGVSVNAGFPFVQKHWQHFFSIRIFYSTSVQPAFKNITVRWSQEDSFIQNSWRWTLMHFHVFKLCMQYESKWNEKVILCLNHNFSKMLPVVFYQPVLWGKNCEGYIA